VVGLGVVVPCGVLAGLVVVRLGGGPVGGGVRLVVVPADVRLVVVPADSSGWWWCRPILLWLGVVVGVECGGAGRLSSFSSMSRLRRPAHHTNSHNSTIKFQKIAYQHLGEERSPDHKLRQSCSLSLQVLIFSKIFLKLEFRVGASV
jgi:hypothetical protein